MRLFIEPNRMDWDSLAMRPYLDRRELEREVETIITQVKENGDDAIIKFTKLFDGASIETLEVPDFERKASHRLLSDGIKNAIKRAIQNITRFHISQRPTPPPLIETEPGITCWTKVVPIESVGLYIPGGSAPLFSSVYMLGIPAKLAGCKEIAICTPPDSYGRVSPEILYTADILGIEKIFRVGGAQAIAALAYGTQSIPRVFKVFGPGNQYVATAKRLVSSDCDCDFDAGPSELLILADEFADPSYVAADLLAQAEHGSDSQVILVTTSLELANKIEIVLEELLEDLPRREVARRALSLGHTIYFREIQSCIDFSNLYAPEHLIIETAKPEDILDGINAAGSIFIGCSEVTGDYIGGPNHCLPTNGKARSGSGLAISDFLKRITVTCATKESLRSIQDDLTHLARAERLEAHARAAIVRGKI